MELKEGIDFYFDDLGRMVLTKEYLFKRGKCCQSYCTNCPWEPKEFWDPNIPIELQLKPND